MKSWNLWRFWGEHLSPRSYLRDLQQQSEVRYQFSEWMTAIKSREGNKVRSTPILQMNSPGNRESSHNSRLNLNLNEIDIDTGDNVMNNGEKTIRLVNYVKIDIDDFKVRWVIGIL